MDDADSDTPGVASDTLDTDNDPMDADSADSGTLVADSDTLDADASNVTEGTEVVTPVVSLQSAQIAIPGQLVFDESWIFQQDLGSYTIQYGASAGVPQLTEFAAEFASEPMIVLYNSGELQKMEPRLVSPAVYIKPCLRPLTRLRS